MSRSDNNFTGLTGVLVDDGLKPIEVENEQNHFYICTACGQAVDMRDLGEVFHHEEDGHKPLKNN